LAAASISFLRFFYLSASAFLFFAASLSAIFFASAAFASAAKSILPPLSFSTLISLA
jgi:hypothetical protein